MIERESLEVTFSGVDPEVLALLSGGELEGRSLGYRPGPPPARLELWWRPRRTLWQWLRRRPRQRRSVVLGSAEITSFGDRGPGEGYSFTAAPRG